MKFLITNDDGVDAPGIESLYDSFVAFLRQSGQVDAEVMVVAPDQGRSECGHSVTTSRDLNVRQVRAGWFSVDGTPVDCVRTALACICPDVDAVFSGINAGANVGIDLLVSGTFAAAREASIHGKPAMAISHYRRPEFPKTWDHAGRWLAPAWKAFFAQMNSPVQRDVLLWNVNLPALPPDAMADGSLIPPMRYCAVDENPMVRSGPVWGDFITELEGSAEGLTAVQLSSDFHNRPRTPGSDVDHCFSGRLTVSSIEPKLTSRSFEGTVPE